MSCVSWALIKRPSLTSNLETCFPACLPDFPCTGPHDAIYTEQSPCHREMAGEFAKLTVSFISSKYVILTNEERFLWGQSFIPCGMHVDLHKSWKACFIPVAHDTDAVGHLEEGAWSTGSNAHRPMPESLMHLFFPTAYTQTCTPWPGR